VSGSEKTLKKETKSIILFREMKSSFVEEVGSLAESLKIQPLITDLFKNSIEKDA